MEYVDDYGVLTARTRRYDRDRGFTRGAFVVVPEWENVEDLNDDALAARYERESERDAEYDALGIAHMLGINGKRYRTRSRAIDLQQHA
jgi:hypothetical protein